MRWGSCPLFSCPLLPTGMLMKELTCIRTAQVPCCAAHQLLTSQPFLPSPCSYSSNKRRFSPRLAFLVDLPRPAPRLLMEELPSAPYPLEITPESMESNPCIAKYWFPWTA